MLEVLFTYFICKGGGMQIEHDRLHVGLFPRSTWRSLVHASGFEYSERAFHLRNAGITYTLMLGVLR